MSTNKIFNLLLLTVLAVPTVRADFHGDRDRWDLKCKAFGAAMLAFMLYGVEKKDQWDDGVPRLKPVLSRWADFWC